MKFLIVENVERHREDAKKVMDDAKLPYLMTDHAQEAISLIEDYRQNGITHVITDIHMGYFEDELKYGEEGEPCGIFVAIAAERMRLPFVFCTNACHHGPRHDWVTQMSRWLRWPEMISYDYGRKREEIGEKKDWARALEFILTQR